MKDNMDLTKLNREMGKTKVLLMSKPEFVFFSTLVLSLKTIWEDNHKTAYVDGRVISWNPEFYLSLSRDERVFVLVHEALHVVWKHLGRGKGLNQKLWQAACDFAINGTLVQRGFKMPVSGGLYEARFLNMSAMDIYNVLFAENFMPPPDMWEDLREPAQKDPNMHEVEVRDMLMRAVTVAKMSAQGSGAIPGDVQIMLNEMLDPRLPWTTILSRWLQARIKTGYNYSRPNKRYQDVFLPSRSGKGLKSLAVFMDTSGSVTDEQFSRMVSELTGVIKRYKPVITLITFDTTINDVHQIRTISELMQIKFKGRGGTCCECVFDWIEENKPDASIVFTDGEFDFQRDKLSRDLVWIINDNKDFVPAFGKAVFYETQ